MLSIYFILNVHVLSSVEHRAENFVVFGVEIGVKVCDVDERRQSLKSFV